MAMKTKKTLENKEIGWDEQTNSDTSFLLWKDLLACQPDELPSRREQRKHHEHHAMRPMPQLVHAS
jgi:hypothetical protein